MGNDGRLLVTQTAFRFLKTLEHMGAAPEHNNSLLWSERLPEGLQRYATEVSNSSYTITYENDDLMRNEWGTEVYGIACCVSAQHIADGVLYFGARDNSAQTVLYAIHGGKDEILEAQVGPEYEPNSSEVIEVDEYLKKFEQMMDWLADVVVHALNVILDLHEQ